MTPLSTTHLGFFALLALYLCAFHGAGQASVIALFITGVTAELLPRILRRIFIPELMLIFGIAFCWLWLIPPGNSDAIHAAAGMAISYWLLVPSRLGMLRWVLSLVIVELLLQSRTANVAMSSLVCVPIGLAALGIDSWLCGAISARASARLKSQAGSSLVRWALVPTAVVVMAAISAGTWVVKEAARHHEVTLQNETRTNRRINKVAGLDQVINIGQHDSVDRDPEVAARLSWESGADPSGTVYLRAMALSELVLDGATLSWKADRTGTLQEAPPATHQPTRWARVLRMPSRDDVVLRPDGGDAVDLDGLVVDYDGNHYRPQLGDALRSYRADFDDGQLEADPAKLLRYRDIDPRLDALPWNEIEDGRWRSVSPERAAVLVRERLGERCAYALKDLPLPKPTDGPGGVLRGFLFSRIESDRRGHCQYFATAAVLLLRRAGHTARCVVGFASDEVGDRGVVFRGLHAHAWIEVVNAQGRWQRFDPTPATYIRDNLIGVELGPYAENANSNEPEPQKLPPVVKPTEVSVEMIARQWWPLLVPLGLVLVFVVILVARRRGAQRHIDPRLAELQRRNDDLVRLAMSLGVAVTPATTLSEVASALQKRTGVALERHLDAHLAARYGNGPLPEPWPIDALRQGARGKVAQSVRS